MQKRTLKQKCLAWLLSLAVAVTFIPMTAGFAFAETKSAEDLGWISEFTTSVEFVSKDDQTVNFKCTDALALDSTGAAAIKYTVAGGQDAQSGAEIKTADGSTTVSGAEVTTATDGNKNLTDTIKGLAEKTDYQWYCPAGQKKNSNVLNKNVVISFTTGEKAKEETPTEPETPAEPDMFINLAKANGPDWADNEVKDYAYFEEPWQVGDDLVPVQVATGEKMQPKLKNISCRRGFGNFTEESADANGNKYFTVDYGEGDWTVPGTYTVTITANDAAAFVTGNGNATAKFTGVYKYECKIVKDPSDLAAADVSFDEGSVNKKGDIEVSYDGKLHKLVPAKVTDTLGNVVDPEYYEVTYPSSTTNAYRKVGQFDIVITAKEGNAGGYTGSITKVVSITDIVTDITVYSQNGLNGERTQLKMFKYGKWGNYALSTPLDWGYNGNVLGTSTNYIPIEALLADAGLGEVGKFNAKDQIDLWTNSDPEHYFNAPLSIETLQKFKYVAKSEKEVLNVFGGEYSIPAFLILDCDNASANPRGAVGSEVAGDTSRGNMSPSAVSEISLVSMDINNLDTTVAKATFNGKAQEPAVKVMDGDTEVPVIVAYENNKKAGNATVTISAKDDSDYYGTATKTFKIAKASNPLAVKAATRTVKVKKVKKKAQTVAGVKISKKGVGTVTYKGVGTNAKSKKALKVNKKTGKITVKKKTKKGTYKIKITATAAGNANYNKVSKPAVVTVKVK